MTWSASEIRGPKNSSRLKSLGTATLTPASWLSLTLASTAVSLQQLLLFFIFSAPLQAPHFAVSVKRTEESLPPQKCIFNAIPMILIR
ncbi:hypothetical protein DBR43_25650 [Pedobacter sp. KBW06]|nr:hypothetical protein DBR43_25650 [Pedobacter sp. KBW06]